LKNIASSHYEVRNKAGTKENREGPIEQEEMSGEWQSKFSESGKKKKCGHKGKENENGAFGERQKRRRT